MVSERTEFERTAPEGAAPSSQRRPPQRPAPLQASCVAPPSDRPTWQLVQSSKRAPAVKPLWGCLRDHGMHAQKHAAARTCSLPLIPRCQHLAVYPCYSQGGAALPGFWHKARLTKGAAMVGNQKLRMGGDFKSRLQRQQHIQHLPATVVRSTRGTPAMFGGTSPPAGLRASPPRSS